MNAHAFEGGFANPPQDGAFAFRAIMNAIAKPGTIFTIQGGVPPTGLSTAAGSVILTLCDPETPIALMQSADNDEVRNWITFHTGAPIVSAADAHFAVGAWTEMMPLKQFRQGTPEFPDRSATLIIECDKLEQSGAFLRGPGIKDTNRFLLPNLEALQRNSELFPLGVDFLFCAGSQVAGLPRTTKVSEV
jgi:alpha-D-ribose 1-methylphosphonate 5-triphosphate synthase subunit PhnH